MALYMAVDPTLTFREKENPVLVDRDGWQRAHIPILVNSAPRLVEAAISQDFGVHHMTDHPGWSIVLLQGSGPSVRISSGGRVFADSVDAMRFVEDLYYIRSTGWEHIYPDFPEPHRSIFNDVMDRYEREGVMLGTRVFPNGVA